MKHIFSILLLLCFSFHSFAQSKPNPKLEELEQRIKELEVEKQGLKSEIESLKKDYNRKADILEKEYVNDRESFKNEVNTENNVMLAFGLVISLLGAAFLYQQFKGFRDYAASLVEKEKLALGGRLNEQLRLLEASHVAELKTVTAANENKIKRMLDRESVEWKARGSVRISLVSVEAEKDGFLEPYLHQLGFEQITIVNASTAKKQLLNTDIVVFNNIKNEFKVGFLKQGSTETEIHQFREQDAIAQIMSKQGDKVLYFYFNKNSNHYPSNSLKEEEILSFANSKPTIYHNLLDLAVYWYKFIKN
jgi:vacuolar-type H+-ATPase subunit I/STV1